MEAIFKPLKEDLLSLFDKNYVEKAKELNNKLGVDLFEDNCVPMYFNGKFDAKTVFVMLNPGYSNKAYSFNTEHKKEYKNVDNFISKQINHRFNFGNYMREKNKPKSFDLKQAAFLQYFNNSEINIPENFWEKDLPIKLDAMENVLMNKLQLELVPYPSNEFKNLFGNKKMALNKIEFFITDINRLLDAIAQYDRKYVIFGAKQFIYLFQAYKEKYSGQVEFGEEKNFKIDGLQNKVYFNTIKIIHNKKQINAGIAYSFPRRDLPNAYRQMSEYGKFCFEEMNSEE